MEPQGADRLRHAIAVLVCLLFGAASQAETLPSGFGGINVGMAWSDVEAGFRYEYRDQPVTVWDEHVRTCGYRSVSVAAQSGELLVEAEDFTVTSVSYVSPIESGSDLLAVADLVLASYGQPERATQRDILGNVTLDRAAVQFITLEYLDPQPVLFSVAGAGLWQYQVQVSYQHQRWHLNRMMRCARDREKAALAPTTPTPQ